MTQNKRTVERYMEGFRRSDYELVLSCLTDDVEWVIPGAVHLHGKVAFDGEMKNPAFTGKPIIATTRLVEEGDTVVAEGTVRATRRGGVVLDLVFCDVFVFRDALIRHLTSYLVDVTRPA